MTKSAHKEFAPLLPDLDGVPAFLVTLDDREQPVIAWSNDDFAVLSGMAPFHRKTVSLAELLGGLGVSDPRPAASQGRWTVRGRDRNGRRCWYEFDIRRAAGLEAETGRPAWIWFVSNDSARIAAQMRVAEAFGLDPAEEAVADAGKNAGRGGEDTAQAYLLDVAHEMRTPLSSVIGALSMLSAHHGGDETARRLIEMARRNADNLMALTDDLLDAADGEERSFQIEQRAVNASDLLSDVVRACAATALQKRVLLSVDQAPDEAWLHADPRRLHQVLTNLVANAIKYAPSGSAVNIRCAARHGEVDIAVADRGPGIPAAERQAVFDRYFQGRNAERNRAEGAGLGLAIVRDLVERQGGRVCLSSRSEEDGAGRTGTEVSVSFPRIEQEAHSTRT